MATNRVAVASVAAAAVATGGSTVATITPGPVNPGNPVLVRADCRLIGATSVTGVTVAIARVSGGAALYSRTYTCTGAVNVAASPAFYDTAYDGSGYNLNMTAVGAACTADATLEAQVVNSGF